VSRGNVQFDAGNTLGMELALRGTEYDALDIAGTATLGGPLTTLWNDFTPWPAPRSTWIVARRFPASSAG
jgi:hypothetical protein